MKPEGCSLPPELDTVLRVLSSVDRTSLDGQATALVETLLAVKAQLPEKVAQVDVARRYGQVHAADEKIATALDDLDGLLGHYVIGDKQHKPGYCYVCGSRLR